MKIINKRILTSKWYLCFIFISITKIRKISETSLLLFIPRSRKKFLKEGKKKKIMEKRIAASPLS